jgi:hypothetical protein
MELLATVFAVESTRRYSHSAMPDAPVVPHKQRASSRTRGLVRRGTAGALRRAADRLEPCPQ